MMKTLIIILTLFNFYGCSKQEKTSNQNADSIKTSNSVPTENVKQTSQTTRQSVKTYKKGDPVEFYDIIYMFLPDENENTDWDNIDKIESVKWEKKNCKGNDCDKTGDLKISINGKKFQSEWWVWVIGQESNWSAFSITYSYNSHDNFDLGYDIDLSTLFNNQKFTSTVINDKNEYNLPYKLYEITIPNKKKFWMKVDESGSGNKIFEFSIKCSLNINDIDKL